MKIKSIKEGKRKTVPKDMQQIPSELVTHDAGDRDRIHPNDPAHVVKPLLRAAAQRLANKVPPVVRAQAAVGALFDQLQQDPFRFQTLDQEVVDLWRAKTILSWAVKPVVDDRIHHLWFAEEHNGHSCGLREGPPPSRGDRPKHLKNLNLEVHVLDWPRRLRDIVKSVGVNPNEALEEIRGKIVSQQAHAAAQKARQAAAARLA